MLNKVLNKKYIRRSQSDDEQLDPTQLAQLTQQSSGLTQTSDSFDWEDQDDPRTCSLCSGSLDSKLIDDDDPLEQIFCEYCAAGSHLKCIKIDSTIDGTFKDLISLIGWKCSKCTESMKNRIQNLENTCTSIKSEITKLKTANVNFLRELTQRRRKVEKSGGSRFMPYIFRYSRGGSRNFFLGGQTMFSNRKLRARPESRARSAQESRAKLESKAQSA